MKEFDNLFVDHQHIFKPPANRNDHYWKVMIVDDDVDVHKVTKLVLHDYLFQGRGLTFIDAFSAKEANEQIARHPDTALILLDVVMEEDDAGLQVVKFIRESLQNEEVRIVLRTGQTGLANEADVARDYDISDYRTKTELTSRKLHTTLFTALKTYSLIHRLQQGKKGLQRLNDISKEQSMEILEKKMLLEAIVNKANKQFIIATDRNHILTYYNQVARDIFCYQPSEVIGLTLEDVLEQENISQASFRSKLEQLEHQDEISFSFKRQKKEREIQINCRLSYITDTAGNRLGFVIVGELNIPANQIHQRNSHISKAPISQHTNSIPADITLPGFIGKDRKMLAIFQLIHDLKDHTAAVLVQGESGSGKELVALSIHKVSRRGDKIFLPINCGALSEHLLESELFGHEQGAFTGAVKSRRGLFEQADGGTLFLDEIGDISAAMQLKLLRVIQEGKLQRLGGEEMISVDVRIISASNKDLRQEITAGNFREDLFYRLGVVPITLPPIRQRRLDIPLLAAHFLQCLKDKQQIHKDKIFSSEAMEILTSYHWPGNAREMQNVIHLATVLSHDLVIQAQHVSINLRPKQEKITQKMGWSQRPTLNKESIFDALHRTANNRVAAAKILGISRATLYRHLAKIGQTNG